MNLYYTTITFDLQCGRHIFALKKNNRSNSNSYWKTDITILSHLSAFKLCSLISFCRVERQQSSDGWIAVDILLCTFLTYLKHLISDGWFWTFFVVPSICNYLPVLVIIFWNSSWATSLVFVCKMSRIIHMYNQYNVDFCHMSIIYVATGIVHDVTTEILEIQYLWNISY